MISVLLKKLLRVLGNGSPDGEAAVREWMNYGDACRARNDSAGAIASYQKALAVQNRHPEVWFRLALAYSLGGLTGEAQAAYQTLLEWAPDHAGAHLNLGIIHHDLKRLSDAEHHYRQAIALRSEIPQAHNCLGVLLNERGDFTEAECAYRRALEVDSGFTEAQCNLGALFNDSGEFEKAICALEDLLTRDPGHADACSHLGLSLQSLRRFEEAISCYRKAITLAESRGEERDQLARHHLNLGYCLLLMGRYGEGWPELEWRRWLPESRGTQIARDFEAPTWNGSEDIAGKSILLYAEEGLGDVIQHARYVDAVSERGATVMLEVYWPLVQLLSQSGLKARVIESSRVPPTSDFQCPLISLPRVLGVTLQDMRATAPYLHADNGRIAAWRRRLAGHHDPRIGLVWYSESERLDLRRRRIPMPCLIDHLPGSLRYASLHKSLPPADLERLKNYPHVAHWSGALNDFSDTAALIACLDLVITIDTAVAHLAGAMGKTVWILLQANADWRWGLEGADCPWYPSARLFRQPSPGAWEPVAGAVAQALMDRYARLEEKQ